MFAIYKIRASVVNVNYRYVTDELRYLLHNADPVAIIYQAEYEPLVAESRDAQPKLQAFVRIDESPSGREPQASGGGDSTSGHEPHPGCARLRGGAGIGVTRRDFEERSDDDVYLLYTGGTTGMPKGVMWRMEDVFYALGGGVDVFTNEKVTSPTALVEKINPDAPSGITMMQTAPFMHGAGQFGLMRTMFEGNTAVVMDGFDAEKVWRRIDELRINVVGFTGDAMARPLADAYERLRDEIDITCLLSFSSTAAVWSQSLKDYFRNELPVHVVMMDAIGSTESGMNGIPRRHRSRRTRSRASPPCSRRSTPSCSTRSSGRCLRAPVWSASSHAAATSRSVTTRIPRRPRPRSSPTPRAGAGRFRVTLRAVEDDGRITLLGRGSVSINSGGEKIFPEEVEQAIKAHPEAFDVLVVGVPDARWGETVCALVQPRPGTEPTLDDIVEVARAQVAGYKVPRKLVLIETRPPPRQREARLHAGQGGGRRRLGGRRNRLRGFPLS